jgi:CHAT domain-containing protein
MKMPGIVPKELVDELEAAQKRGDLDGRIELLGQLLSWAQQQDDAVLEIVALRFLGNAYQDKDELRKAHSYRVTAAKLIEVLGPDCPQQLRMWVECDLGRSYIVVEDWSKGEAHTQRALEIAGSLADEQATCMFKLNLGLVYFQTGRKQEAFQLGTEVIQVAERLQDHYILGLQHLNLASFCLQHGFRINDSLRHARQALAHADLSEDTQLRMRAQEVLGKSLRAAHLLTNRSRFAKEAEDNLRQTVELAQSLDNLSLEANAEIEWAGLCDDRRQPAEAAAHYNRALDLLDKVRGGLGYEEFQLTYFESFQPTYDKVTEFFLRQGQPDQAFLTAERSRSRLLLALLGPGRSNTRSWSSTERSKLAQILDLYGREVIREYSNDRGQSQSRGVTVGLQAAEGDETTSDTPSLRDARQRFLHLYESQQLYYASWHRQQSPPVAGFKEAQRFLGPDDALLSYLVTDQSIVIFVATDRACHFQQLGYPREKIANDVEELCMAMSEVQDQFRDLSVAERWFFRKPQDPWPTAVRESVAQLDQKLEKLYALLIAPTLAVIDRKPHWVIVPHGPLHRVPWAALRGAGHYLVEQHSISLLPSASLGTVLETREFPAEGKAVFLANPDPDDPDLHLPAAQSEVDAGYQVFQAGPLPFIGPAATKGEFLLNAPMARHLHLACHHFFDAKAPLLSFLKLAGDSGAGFLYAFEVAELDLTAELVVLSACQSGRSRIATGDEQIGIVRAFLAAGAHSVISTLWSIQDASAAALFTDFYTRALGTGLAKALAQAQRALLADPRYTLPCFWAPYVLSGRWNKPLTYPKRAYQVATKVRDTGDVLTVDALIAEGFRACEFEQYDKARACYTKACLLDPGSSLAWYNLGVVEYRAKNFEAAVEALTKVIELREHSVVGAYGKALCLRQLAQSFELPPEYTPAARPRHWAFAEFDQSPELPPEYTREPELLDVEAPVRNLAHELCNRGYDAKVTIHPEYTLCQIEIKVGPVTYKLSLQGFVMGMVSEGFYREEGGKEINMGDPSIYPDPTETDKEFLAFQGQLSWWRLVQMPVVPPPIPGEEYTELSKAAARMSITQEPEKYGWIRQGRTHEEVFRERAARMEPNVKFHVFSSHSDLIKQNEPGTFTVCAFEGKPYLVAKIVPSDDIPLLRSSVEAGRIILRTSCYTYPTFPIIYNRVFIPIGSGPKPGTARGILIESATNFTEANFQEWAIRLKRTQYMAIYVYSDPEEPLASGEAQIDPQIVNMIIEAINQADSALRAIPPNRRSFEAACRAFFLDRPEPFLFD